MKELSSELTQLLEEGKKNGFVTYERVNTVLPPDLIAPSRIEGVLMRLSDEGIDVIDDSDVAERMAARELIKATKAAKEAEPASTASVERIDDPVRMYLTAALLAKALIQEEDFSDEEKKALGDFIDFLVDRADSARISQDVQEVTEESDDEQVLAIQEKIRQKHSSRLGRRRPQRDDTPLPPENPRRKPDGPAGGPSEDEDDDLDTACF